MILDKNKNKTWERKEWKTFKELVTNNKYGLKFKEKVYKISELMDFLNFRSLRRCGRKMLKYCDVNNDRKITLSEWRSCLQPQRADSSNQPDFKPPQHLFSSKFLNLTR